MKMPSNCSPTKMLTLFSVIDKISINHIHVTNPLGITLCFKKKTHYTLELKLKKFHDIHYEYQCIIDRDDKR